MEGYFYVYLVLNYMILHNLNLKDPPETHPPNTKLPILQLCIKIISNVDIN